MLKKAMIIFLFAASVLVIVTVNSATGEESCYELGYRYGLCATKSIYGIPCKPENDISIPIQCRGHAETQEGIKAGTKAVNNMIKSK
jgi:hypothetical protein